MRIREFDLLGEANNFEKYKNIESVLVYENLGTIKTPLITIAIPTYNRHELLKEAIESVLIQKEVDFDYEIMIVDNQSEFERTTETEKLILSYTDSRIVYYKNTKNLGMIGNWNRCIQLARGKWVAFLHDDDLLSEDYLFNVSKIINKKKKIVCLASKFETFVNKETIVPNNKRLADILYKKKSPKLMKISKFDSILWNTNPYGAPTCGALFLRQTVIEEGGFNDEYFPSSDWFFIFRINMKYRVYRPINLTGYYRFSVNESLNTETKFAFVRDIEKFRNYVKNKSIVGKIIYFLFRNEQHAILAEKLVHEDKKHELTLESFNEIRNYRNNRMKKFIYKLMLLIYWKIKRILTIVL